MDTPKLSVIPIIKQSESEMRMPADSYILQALIELSDRQDAIESSIDAAHQTVKEMCERMGIAYPCK